MRWLILTERRLGASWPEAMIPKGYMVYVAQNPSGVKRIIRGKIRDVVICAATSPDEALKLVRRCSWEFNEANNRSRGLCVNS